MSGRQQKGQVLILILIVVLAIIVAFALLSIHEGQVRSTPQVQEAFWQVNSHTVTNTTVNNEVEGHIIIKATEDYDGSIVLKVRKDISWWMDSDYSTKTMPVSLKAGQTTELELAFTPDQASAGNLRGYFIEIDFSALRTKWIMENTYPPRLRVLSQSQNPGNLA